METDKEKINRLYQSEDISNQLIAIGMLDLIGETAANFIWEDILSKIKKDEVIKKRRASLAWANHSIFVDIFIIGGRLQVICDLQLAIVYLPNRKGVAIVYRGSGMAKKEYEYEIIKKLKEYVFKHTYLFTDIEPDF